MKTWNELTHFAGLDWAGDHHDVAVVERTGKVVAEFRIEHELRELFRRRAQREDHLGQTRQSHAEVHHRIGRDPCGAVALCARMARWVRCERSNNTL